MIMKDYGCKNKYEKNLPKILFYEITLHKIEKYTLDFSG